jgi:hypothetical protein
MDIDILIRKSDGTVRTTRATGVANSANLASTALTLSGNYSWTSYTVVDPTDYLEIDYYCHVTTASPAQFAYLRTDDRSLASGDHTRIDNMMLPCEFTGEVILSGTSNTNDWDQLIWSIDSCWTASNISVTMQLYNFTAGAYATAGNGFIAYTSSSLPSIDETKSQTVTIRLNNFRDSSGNWKIKIKGIQSLVRAQSPFDLNVDWIEFGTYVFGREGWFGFQDHSGSETIQSVNIQFECKHDDDDYFDFRLDSNSTYHSLSGLSNSYGWKGYDVTSILNSWSKINGAKICVLYRKAGDTASNVYIRRCKIVIAFRLNTFRIVSTVGNSVLRTEFLRINQKKPGYGSSTAYVIHHGIVRDILQQEAEWSSGISSCPNIYSQIVLTLPANATYYTYSLRTIFVESSLNRNITDLSPIQVEIDVSKATWGGIWGQVFAENGTSLGNPLVNTVFNETRLFYNRSSFETGWAHHWSEFIKNNHGGGVMFTNSSNFKLYAFDSTAGYATGALSAKDTYNLDMQLATLEVDPVIRHNVFPFNNALDMSWEGAVVGFDSGIGTDTIYPSSGGIGLWVIVEYPPQIAVS